MANRNTNKVQALEKEIKMIYADASIDVSGGSGGGPALPAANTDIDNFAILASSTVTNTGFSVVTGDLGLSPGTSVTGFPPGIVIGTQHVANAAAAAAQVAWTARYNYLVAQPVDANHTGTDLGTLTLLPGVYQFNTSAQLTGTLTLDANGDPGAVWIFIIGSTLTTAPGSSVNIIGGGSAGNVFWALGSSGTIDTTTVMKGNIYASVSITLNTGASLDGAALASTGAVSLDTNAVTKIASTPTSPLVVDVALVDALGVTSITRNSAGNYTLLLEDRYVSLAEFQAMQMSSSADDITFSLVSEDVDNAKTVRFRSMVGGVEADPSSAVNFLIKLDLKNSSV